MWGKLFLWYGRSDGPISGLIFEVSLLLFHFGKPVPLLTSSNISSLVCPVRKLFYLVQVNMASFDLYEYTLYVASVLKSKVRATVVEL